jgi:hypothetical protein
MRAALAHYEQLGFEAMAWEEGAEWAWVRFGAAELHLYLKRDHDPARTAAAADLAVTTATPLKHAGARRAFRHQ